MKWTEHCTLAPLNVEFWLCWLLTHPSPTEKIVPEFAFPDLDILEVKRINFMTETYAFVQTDMSAARTVGYCRRFKYKDTHASRCEWSFIIRCARHCSLRVERVFEIVMIVMMIVMVFARDFRPCIVRLMLWCALVLAMECCKRVKLCVLLNVKPKDCNFVILLFQSFACHLGIPGLRWAEQK